MLLGDAKKVTENVVKGCDEENDNQINLHGSSL
jgi:hypothetical protein